MTATTECHWQEHMFDYDDDMIDGKVNENMKEIWQKWLCVSDSEKSD